jgi:dihydrofolate synthase/folylpolyglutamate synthase
MTYEEAVRHLYGLQWHGIKPGLETITALTDAMGRPHTVYPTVHIAGTNGKGSTAAMIAQILREAGYRVGLYTSPHLIEFNERIRIGGVPVSNERIATLTEQVLRRQPSLSNPVTFFEFTTALAFAAFAQAGVDLAVIEVGLGGRFDATNIVTPLVAVITTVHYDHQAHLGDTLARIAFEKAGVIKPTVPVVCGLREDEPLRVIQKTARDRGAPLTRLDHEVSVEGEDPSCFEYRGMEAAYQDLSCGLRGRHQVRNAGCALAAVEWLRRGGVTIPDGAVRAGLRSVRWEGRLEEMRPKPDGPLILLDGAHNREGVRALAGYLEETRSRYGKTVLVFGVLADKEADRMLAELIPLVDALILTQPDHPRALSANELGGRAKKAGYRPPQIKVRLHVSEAVAEAVSAANGADRVCVAGSLFVVGEAKAHLTGRTKPSILRG